MLGQKTNMEGFKMTEKSNLELDLSVPYEKLWEGFSSDCRRNITMASKRKIEMTNDVSPDELINLFQDE